MGIWLTDNLEDLLKFGKVLLHAGPKSDGRHQGELALCNAYLPTNGVLAVENREIL
jgi:hypothetical protein